MRIENRIKENETGWRTVIESLQEEKEKIEKILPYGCPSLLFSCKM